MISEAARVQTQDTKIQIAPVTSCRRHTDTAVQGRFVTGVTGWDEPVTPVTRHISAAQRLVDPSQRCDRRDEHPAAL